MTQVTKVPVTVQVPTQFQNPLPAIEGALRMFAQFAPVFTAFFPQIGPIAAFEPVAEKTLEAVDDLRTSSNAAEVMHKLGTHMQTIGAVVQQLSQHPAIAPQPVADPQANRDQIS